MVRYYLNWMGPLRGDGSLSGGRIDIWVPGVEHGPEYGVPLMSTESWGYLGSWLIGLESEEILSKEEIFRRFEEETGRKIEWNCPE